MSTSLLLAVPSNNPGGMDAERSDHFGHCDVFTLVKINDGNVEEVTTVSNQDHGAGGCMVPVQFLKDQGVQAIVVGGIGARPMQGFADVGIDVYFADRNAYKDVRSVVEGMVGNKFPLIRPDQACKGHGNCH
jgi:predicted Fe-Mo cluster-binding NifX family protein